MHVERKSFKRRNGADVPAVVIAHPSPCGAAVVVHGYGGCKEEQLGLAWRIAEAGLTVCAIDLCGHGEHRLRLDKDISEDVEAAIEYCRSFGKTAAIGHSLGGRLALLSSADAAVGISPALNKEFGDFTRKILKDLRGHRVSADSEDAIFDILAGLPQWRPSDKPALLLYASKDIPEISKSCMEYKAQGVQVQEIERASHGDIFLQEKTFSIIAAKIKEWF